MSHGIRTAVGLLAFAMVASGAVMVWALQKSWAIGVKVSDSGGNGSVDQILWLWLLLSLAVAVSSLLSLIIILSRHHARQHGRL